jgi:hypothetical protein
MPNQILMYVNAITALNFGFLFVTYFDPFFYIINKFFYNEEGLSPKKERLQRN